MSNTKLKTVATSRKWEAWRSLRDKAWNTDYRNKLIYCLNYQRVNAGLPPYNEPDIPTEKMVIIRNKIVAHLENSSKPLTISKIIDGITRNGKIPLLHISIVVGKMVDAGELIARVQGSYDIASNRQPLARFVLPKDAPKDVVTKNVVTKNVVTKDIVTKPTEVTIAVKDGVFIPHDPLGALDDLVASLLDSGSEIHKRSWFKELQLKHPPKGNNPTMQDVTEHLKDDDHWQTSDQIIDSFLNLGIPIVSKDGFVLVLNRLAETNEVETKQQANQRLYRIRSSEPRTDEESILDALFTKPNDWVNTAWLAKELNIPADDQDKVCLLEGKLLELTRAKKVRFELKQGDHHWQIANNT